jgi:hypothetical protein
MERTIHQDARPVRKLFAVSIPASVIVVTVALMGFVYWQGQKDIGLLLQGGAVLALTLMMLFGMVAFVVIRPRAQWAAKDDGLIRTKPGGEPQLIRWDQIYKMKNTGLMLVIRWRDDATEAANRPASALEHRDNLFVATNEADELISSWRRHLPSEA